MRLFKKFVLICLIVGFLGILVLLFLVASIRVPDVGNFEERRVAQSTKIYDRTEEILLYDIHGEEKRTVVSFSDIPRNVKNATIALEDDAFYRHFGFRPLSFARALINNIWRGGWEQGGSTITQQLVKNTLLTSKKNVFRKFKEIIIALKIERIYSKDEILNLYLNQIPYGSNAYGIEAAAESFFGKHAQDLTLLETAYLVSLPNAPSYYSPYGKHRKELDARAKFTLNKMRALDFVTETEYGDASRATIKFAPSRVQGIVAPHFVIDVKEELFQKFGEEVVEKNGLRVITTLNVEIQKIVEEILAKRAPEIEKNFNASNASVVVVDPKTGDLLALAGSRDYFDAKIDGNFNVATALRQPGSAFKPFVYATALKKGLTPETVLFDLPTEFNPSCSASGKPTWVGENEPSYEEESKKCYHPKNFDEKFRGPVSLRESLAQSLNVPSVKTLYLAGLEDVLLTAKDFGISSLNDPGRYGLTLVLGGGEVSLLELTSAFGVLANDGVRNPYKYIVKIEDAAGNEIYSRASEPREVIDKNIARAISDILSDNKARAPAFGEASALYFPGRRVAAKTGTTNDFRDAWVLGYTPDIVVGAWAGNNNNSPMEKRVAGFIVAPFWHEIMENVLVAFPSSDFPAPEEFENDKPWLRGEWMGGQEFVIDKISGKLAGELTPKEFQKKLVVREIHSVLYWLGKQTEAQFKNWEEPIRKWAYDRGLFDENTGIIPLEYDDIHTPQNFPKIKVFEIFPKKQDYKLGEKILIKVVLESKYPITQIDFFGGSNEQYLGSVKKEPFEFKTELSEWMADNEKKINIKIKIYDGVGNAFSFYAPLIGIAM